MDCPICCNGTRVLNSYDKGLYRDRVRKCEICGHRFVTIEMMQFDHAVDWAKVIYENECVEAGNE